MSSDLHCASCGRLNKPRPDGADPVSYMGRLWCAWCAAISQTNTGTIYVAQPSLGLMVEGPKDDPLTAWQDCYSMQPKKRILVRDAKSEIQRAWAIWDGDKTTENSIFVFFGWLSRHRPYFLTFRGKGDPWQKVHSWLIQYEREQQNLTDHK
jgi:hypothetical protein